jgi:hypothetical protein
MTSKSSKSCLLTLIRRRLKRVAGRGYPHHRARPRPRRRNLETLERTLSDLVNHRP